MISNKNVYAIVVVLTFSFTFLSLNSVAARRSAVTTTTKVEESSDNVNKAAENTTITTTKTTASKQGHTHHTTTNTGSKKTAPLKQKLASKNQQQASTTTANNIINSDFSTWTGGSTTLTATQLVAAMSNSSITNRQEAAVLGAIADRVNDVSIWNASSLATIKSKLANDGYTNIFPNASYPNGAKATYSGMTIILTPVKGSNPLTYTTQVTFTQTQLTNAMNANKSKLYNDYTKSLTNLNNSYTANGKAKLGYGIGHPLTKSTHLIQGPVGDCYFVSAVNAVLQSDPRSIERMIKPVKGEPNTYTVEFKGASGPITVQLTPAEVAATSQVKDGGVWLAILSNAEAQYRADSVSTFGTTKGTAIQSEGTLDMLHGGTEVQTFQLMTGKTYKQLAITNLSSSTLDQGFKKMSDKMEPLLKHPGYFAVRPPVGISTSGHALLIVGYDPKTQQLIILNPWGTTGYYNPTTMNFSSTQPTANTDEWFAMKNGEFTISVSALQTNGFVGIAVPDSNTSNF